METFEREVAEIRSWFSSARFRGIRRLHSAREVAEQRGRIRNDYTIARTPQRRSTPGFASSSSRRSPSPRSAPTRRARPWR